MGGVAGLLDIHVPYSSIYMLRAGPTALIPLDLKKLIFIPPTPSKFAQLLLKEKNLLLLLQRTAIFVSLPAFPISSSFNLI